MLTHMEGAHFLHMLTHMAGLLRSSSIWSRRTPSLGWGPPTPPYAYTYGEEATRPTWMARLEGVGTTPLQPSKCSDGPRAPPPYTYTYGGSQGIRIARYVDLMVGGCGG